MQRLKKMISLSLAFMMSMSIMPADMMKMTGVEIIKVAAESTENTDDEFNDFKFYSEHTIALYDEIKVKKNTNEIVWSGQNWFNYRYCVDPYGLLIEIPETLYWDSKKQFSDSYSSIKPDGDNYYGTYIKFIIALQVELINAGYLSREDVGDAWGSFGEKTSKAFDKMIDDCNGLDGIAKKYPDIIRIIHYALGCNGYGKASSFEQVSEYLFYSSGELEHIIDPLKSLLTDCGLMNNTVVDDENYINRITDPIKEFNSLIMKAILNTDSYKCYPEGVVEVPGEPFIRDFQQYLNAYTFGCTYEDTDENGNVVIKTIGIGPCDGVYSRDANFDMIYLYQKLLFEKYNVDVEPNGYFGETTLAKSPTIKRSEKYDKNIFRLIKMALSVNSYDHVYHEYSYEPRIENLEIIDNDTAYAIHAFKLMMSMDNAEDTIVDKTLIAALFTSKGDTSRTCLGCDTSKQLTQDEIDELKKRGYEYVGRYVVGESFDQKRISEQEAQLIIENGLKIIPIYQGYNTTEAINFNYDKGIKDAADSIDAAEKIGIPKGSTIYYAVDADVYGDEIKTYVIPYFEALTKEMAKYKDVYKIGIYSARNTCQKVYDAGYCSHAYVSDSSTGYSGNRACQMPTNWTYDQFATDLKIEYKHGYFEIDKVAISKYDSKFSDIDPGVSKLDNSAKDYFDIEKDEVEITEGRKFGDPVDLATGAHVIDYTAASVEGALNFDLSFSYSSDRTNDSEVGLGWYHNYEKHLETGKETKTLLDFDLLSKTNLEAEIPIEVITEEYVNVYDSPEHCTKYVKSETDSDIFVPEIIDNGLKKTDTTNSSAEGTNSLNAEQQENEQEKKEYKKGYTLSKAESQWILNCNNKEWYYYDLSGNLIGHKNKEGFMLKIKNDASELVITEPISNKSITAKKENGKITKISIDSSENNVELCYNDKSELISIKDMNGNTVSYEYDSDHPGRIVSGTDSDNIKYFEDYYYDFDSLAPSLFAGYREKYSVTEDVSNDILLVNNKFIDYARNTSEYQLKNGRIREQKDANGNISLFDYSVNYNKGENRYLTVTTIDRNESQNQNPKCSKSVFDENNILISYTDSNGNETKYGIDPVTHNILSVTDAGGFTETREYDSRNNITKLTDKTGMITHYEYYENTDNVKKEIKCDKDDNEISHISYEYNSSNLLEKMTDERGNVTSYEYDSNNLLVSQKTKYLISVINGKSEYGEKIYKYEYKNGLLNSITDPDGNTAGTDIDQDNNTVKITTLVDGDKDKKITLKENSYDDYGNLLSEKIIFNNKETRTINHEYNCRELETKTSDDKGIISQKEYDGNGNVLSSSDECGYTTKYEYDREDRLIKITGPEGNITKIEYDSGGRILKQYDPEGVLTEYSYDTAENTVEKSIKEADENGEYHTVDKSLTKYDGNGKILSVTDYNGTKTVNIYNNRDNLEKTIYAYGTDAECIKKYEYNAYGDLTKTIIQLDDENEITEQFEYDSFGNQISYTDGNDNKTTFTYDECGRMKTETNALNLTITYNYDSFGNLESIVSPDKHITKYEYDYQGRQISVTDPLGNKSTISYDIRNNTKETVDKTGNGKVAYDYYNNNKLKSITDSYDYTINYDYDKSGNLIKMTDALGYVTEYSYDQNGKLIETTDALNNIISTEYDALGNTTSINDKYYSSVSYTYDSSGNIISRSSGCEESITYDYNILNQCTAETNGRKQKTVYTYDKAGRLTDFVQYDAEGNEINKGSFKYDNCGNILEAQDKFGVIKRIYDKLNRLIEYTDTYGNTVKYVYDNENNISKIIYPSAETEKEISVSYEYDAAANLIAVTDWNGNKTTYEYDENGNVKSEKRSNNTELTIEYNSNGNVKSSLDINSSDQKITSYSYSYNGNGQLITENDYVNNTVNSMKYDALGRLTGRTSTNADTLYDYRVNVIKSVGSMSSEEFCRKLWNYDVGITKKEGYDYDPSGNVKTSVKDVYKNGEAVNSLFARSFEYSKGNQLKNYTDINGKMVKDASAAFELGIVPFSVSNTPVYDSDGNMTGVSQNGKDVSLGYDINNRLTIYGETEYTYDVEGNLIKEKTGNTETTYVYDTTFGVPRVLVSTTGDQKTYYVYGNDLINEETGNSRKYYHYDLNGNTVSLTDESGNVTDTYRYESFGKSEHVKGTSDTPFKYAATSGVMTNKNGLMYMYTRYYDPELMRFVSADILTGKSGNTQSLNRYAYCEGDPINYTDPFGTSPEIRKKNRNEKISSWTHGVLDVAGMIPVVGAVADGINVVFYMCEDDMGMAFLSAIAFIPVAGEFAGGSKVGIKGAEELGSHLDDITELGTKYGNEAAEALLKNLDNGEESILKFYTVQSKADATRLIDNKGLPWPTKDYRANFGEGVYAWGNIDDANNYLNRRITRLKENNIYDDNNPLEILKIEIDSNDFKAFKQKDLTILSDEEASKFWEEFGKLLESSKQHDYKYIKRGTEMGVEHYFNKTVINKLHIYKLE